jgi:hypothetical protein
MTAFRDRRATVPQRDELGDLVLSRSLAAAEHTCCRDALDSRRRAAYFTN